MTRLGKSTVQKLVAATVFFHAELSFCGGRWTGADISDCTMSTNDYSSLSFSVATNVIREISSMNIHCEVNWMSNWTWNTNLTRSRKFTRAEELRFVVELLYETGFELEKRGDVLHGITRTNKTDLSDNRDAALERTLAARSGAEDREWTLDYDNAPIDMVVLVLAEATDTFIICSPVVYMDNSGTVTLKGKHRGIGFYFEELAKRGLALQRVTDRILVLKGMPQKIDRIFSQAQGK